MNKELMEALDILEREKEIRENLAQKLKFPVVCFSDILVGMEKEER